jgi:hypothetical protein
VANTEIPLQQPLPSAIVIELPYAAAPRELKLFSKAGSKAAEDEEATNHVTRPKARYPIQAASWSVSLFSGLPRMEDEQCSTKEAASTGRDWVDLLQQQLCLSVANVLTAEASRLHVNTNLDSAFGT